MTDRPRPTEMATGMRARELALWATSDCDRVRALGTIGSAGRQAAAWFQAKHPDEFETGTSRFASEAGFTHESALLMNDSARLRDVYANEGGVTVGVDGIHSLIHLDPLAVLNKIRISDEEEAEAKAASERLYLECAQGAHPESLLIFQARVEVHVGTQTHKVKPDAVVWTGTEFRVGEMKAYIDRGGYTDPTSVGSAVRQAAAGVVGLRQFLTRNGHPSTLVSDRVDLVFRRRRGGGVSLRRLDATPEIEALTTTVNTAETDRTRYLTITGGAPFSDETALKKIPMAFTAQCRETCGLAEMCQAEQANDPSARYGNAVKELAAVGVSVHRARDLAAGATPQGAAERRAAYALRAAYHHGGLVTG